MHGHFLFLLQQNDQYLEFMMENTKNNLPLWIPKNQPKILFFLRILQVKIFINLKNLLVKYAYFLPP